MEAIVLVALEEVRVSICVFERCIQIVWHALPVGDGLGIAGFDGWSLGRIETPEFAALEEVDLAVSTPDHSRVQVIRNASEAFANLFGIGAIHLAALIAPVLRTLEEVGLAILVRKGSIDVAGQSGPALRYELWVTLLHRVCRQLVVFVALEGKGFAMRRVEQRVDLGVLANGIIQWHLWWRIRGSVCARREGVGGRVLIGLASIERLYSRLIILIQLEYGLKAAIEGRHQS